MRPPPPTQRFTAVDKEHNTEDLAAPGLKISRQHWRCWYCNFRITRPVGLLREHFRILPWVAPPRDRVDVGARSGFIRWYQGRWACQVLLCPYTVQTDQQRDKDNSIMLRSIVCLPESCCYTTREALIAVVINRSIHDHHKLLWWCPSAPGVNPCASIIF